MNRREKKLREQDYYNNPANSWKNVFKGAFLAIVASKMCFLIAELAWEILR